MFARRNKGVLLSLPLWLALLLTATATAATPVNPIKPLIYLRAFPDNVIGWGKSSRHRSGQVFLGYFMFTVKQTDDVTPELIENVIVSADYHGLKVSLDESLTPSGKFSSFGIYGYDSAPNADGFRYVTGAENKRYKYMPLVISADELFPHGENKAILAVKAGTSSTDGYLTSVSHSSLKSLLGVHSVDAQTNELVITVTSSDKGIHVTGDNQITVTGINQLPYNTAEIPATSADGKVCFPFIRDVPITMTDGNGRNVTSSLKAKLGDVISTHVASLDLDLYRDVEATEVEVVKLDSNDLRVTIDDANKLTVMVSIDVPREGHRCTEVLLDTDWGVPNLGGFCYDDANLISDDGTPYFVYFDFNSVTESGDIVGSYTECYTIAADGKVVKDGGHSPSDSDNASNANDEYTNSDTTPAPPTPTTPSQLEQPSTGDNNNTPAPDTGNNGGDAPSTPTTPDKPSVNPSDVPAGAEQAAGDSAQNFDTQADAADKLAEDLGLTGDTPSFTQPDDVNEQTKVEDVAGDVNTSILPNGVTVEKFAAAIEQKLADVIKKVIDAIIAPEFGDVAASAPSFVMPSRGDADKTHQAVMTIQAEINYKSGEISKNGKVLKLRMTIQTGDGLKMLKYSGGWTRANVSQMPKGLFTALAKGKAKAMAVAADDDFVAGEYELYTNTLAIADTVSQADVKAGKAVPSNKITLLAVGDSGDAEPVARGEFSQITQHAVASNTQGDVQQSAGSSGGGCDTRPF